jgi:hypothetical protein
MDAIPRRVDLGATEVRSSVQNLALKVRRLHNVEVHESKRTHAGCSEIKGTWRAKSAGTDEKHACFFYTALAFDTNFIEKQMTGIAECLLRVERRERARTMRVAKY